MQKAQAVSTLSGKQMATDTTMTKDTGSSGGGVLGGGGGGDDGGGRGEGGSEGDESQKVIAAHELLRRW